MNNTPQASSKGMVDSLGMGQLGMGTLKSMNSFPLEIAYKDVKYNFQVQRTSADVFTFTINGGSFEAKVRESPDGSLLCEFGGGSFRHVFTIIRILSLVLRLEKGVLL